MASTSNTLDRASLGDAHQAPAPASTFAQHRAAIAHLLVLDGERVLSVDLDRVALLWNPRTAALIARHELPATAILSSVFATSDGRLAYVAADAGTLAVHALDGHGVLARVVTNAAIRFAQCTADLARVLVASEDELVLISLVDGEPLARASVASHEPEILALHADDRRFLVRFHHVAMDMYPTDAETAFDSSTLAEIWRPSTSIDPLAPASSLARARVAIRGAFARVTLADERPLPDLVAHAHPICRTAWLAVDEVLLTADTGGAIHRWDLDLAAARVPAQHARAITGVRFTQHGVVSFTTHDTKLWRDEALVATLPAVSAPLIHEASLIDTGQTVRTYSLVDGACLASHATAPGAATVGARGRTCVGLADAFPNRVVSLRDGHERTLPQHLDGILSGSAPPIVHAGRLLLAQYTAPTRSLSLDTLAVRAERVLHVHGTSWTALHPDGITLYSAGYADGRVATSSFVTLAERAHWTIFDGDDAAISTAVLLPVRAEIIVAGKARLRRFGFDRGALADCSVAHAVDALVADAAEQRVVVFTADGTARVIDVDRMTWVDARPGEIDDARTRRRSPTPTPGFDAAFVCDHWLVGWSRGLAVTPVALAGGALRAPFSTRQVSQYRAALVDDTREQLWLLSRDGALVRISLRDETAGETVATIANGTKLSWVTPSVFAAHDEDGSLHYLRTTGERICTLERFAMPPYAPQALADSVAVCAMSDGALRVASIPGDACVLRDPRATVAATAVALAVPFVASLHGNRVLRWDLRTSTCTGAWTASTTLAAIDVRADGAVLAGEANGRVTLLRQCSTSNS